MSIDLTLNSCPQSQMAQNVAWSSYQLPSQTPSILNEKFLGWEPTWLVKEPSDGGEE